MEPTYLKKMMTQAHLAMQNAYAPYSKFHVGCCLKTINNQFFSGTNVENSAFASTQCAETSAIGAMITQGEKFITDVVIMAAAPAFCSPCGNCRQKLAEFVTPEAQVHICNPDTLIQTIPFNKLLPYCFHLQN